MIKAGAGIWLSRLRGGRVLLATIAGSTRSREAMSMFSWNSMHSGHVAAAVVLVVDDHDARQSLVVPVHIVEGHFAFLLFEGGVHVTEVSPWRCPGHV